MPQGIMHSIIVSVSVQTTNIEYPNIFSHWGTPVLVLASSFGLFRSRNKDTKKAGHVLGEVLFSIVRVCIEPHAPSDQCVLELLLLLSLS